MTEGTSLPGNAILLSDCIAGMNALPAGSVDLAFADPPFNIGYDYDVYDDRKQREEYLDWSRDWIAAVHRVLKPDGTFWLAIGDEYAAELKIVSQEVGFHCRSWVIWYYTFGVNCKDEVQPLARPPVLLREGPEAVHVPRRRSWRIASPRPGSSSTATAAATPTAGCPTTPGFCGRRTSSATSRPTKTPGTSRAWPARSRSEPVSTAARCPSSFWGASFASARSEDEVVLDPFSGSATTLAVAKKLGRRFVGFDLSPDYVKQGTDRLAEIRVGDALEGAAEPTMSAPVTPVRRGEQRRPPLELVLEASSKDQEDRARAAFDEGLIEAFQRVNQGYSPDRVIADPGLNAELAAECARLALPGDTRWWNRNLFRLRKAGRLKHIPTGRRTELSWERCDDFLFASEIAWRQMLDRGFAGLDEILCDPDLSG